MKRPQPNELAIRLRAARKMAGLSMEDLARRLDGLVTKQAISKYEQGLMKPSPEVLEKITKVLNLSPAPAHPSYFKTWASPTSPVLARQPNDSETTVHCIRLPRPEIDRDSNVLAENIQAFEFDPSKVQFRARRRLPAKLASSLEHRIADYMRKYLHVETLLGRCIEFRNPLDGLKVATPDEAEQAARKVRDAWGLGSAPIVNLLGRLEAAGIGVLEVKTDDSFDGLSGGFAGRPIIAINKNLPLDRVRFTASHELAHILCGLPGRETDEGLCHEFAAAFLLPRAVLEKALMPARHKVTLWELREIKESYGISLQAIMHRAHTLGLITDRQLRHFRETLRARGWDITEPVAYKGKDRAVRFKQLLNCAVAENILDLNTAAELLGVPSSELKNEIGDIF